MPPLILHGATQPLSTVTSSQQFDTLTGVKQGVPHCAFPMQTGGKFNSFPVALADSFWQRGQLYCHTWGAWDHGTGVAWAAADVVAGKYDPYLHAQAALLKQWAHPFFLRLDHEMQWPGAPWFMMGDQYVAIWQHLVDLFRQDGATNATWVWCPNQIDPGRPAVDAWYPGDEYVDWVGFDAYNGAGARNSSWRSWAEVSDLSYSTLLALAPRKPMMIGEFASHDQGGNKAQWITEGFQYIATQQTAIRATSWFNKTNGLANWPLSAVDGSAAAYAAAIKAGPYAIAGTYPMPPGGRPIVPLYGAEWGGADAYDLAVKLGQANATIASRDLFIAALQGGVTDLNAQLAARNAQYATATDALAAARTEADRWRIAAGQVVSGLDNLRGMLPA